jgi:hypothetical protein
MQRERIEQYIGMYEEVLLEVTEVTMQWEMAELNRLKQDKNRKYNCPVQLAVYSQTVEVTLYLTFGLFVFAVVGDLEGMSLSSSTIHLRNAKQSFSLPSIFFLGVGINF